MGPFLLALFSAVQAAGPPAAVLFQSEGREMKGEPSPDLFTVTLTNSGDAPVWLAWAFPSADAPYTFPADGTLRPREADAWLRTFDASDLPLGVPGYNLGPARVIRLRPGQTAAILDVWRPSRVDVAVAHEIRVDGTRELQQVLFGRVRASGCRSLFGDDLPSDPALCREDLLDRWSRRWSWVQAAWTERWVGTVGPVTTDWRLRTQPDDWHAPPVMTVSTGMVPAKAKALEGSSAQVTAWLDANGARVLAATDGFVWEVPSLGHVVLTSVAREIRRGSLFPVGTLGADGELDEAWSWHDRVRWTGTVWESLGELPGYARLRDGPWRRIGPDLGEIGLNASMNPPDARQSMAERQRGVEVTGPTPTAFVTRLLTREPVQACYADARHGGAWKGIDAVGGLLTGPLPAVPTDADPSFGGLVTLVATVAADGRTTGVRVESAATPRFIACMAKAAPRAWNFLPSLDGRPYTVRAAWFLQPGH